MSSERDLSELKIVEERLASYFPGRPWRCKEIGTGNINFIYLADRGDKKIIVKKDLNFARINPEKFPLPIERILYEYRAYSLYAKSVPEMIPQIHFFDLDQGILAMEYLFPHTLLRQGLLQGNKYPQLASHLGTFLAKSLYSTSRYYLSKKEWMQNVDLFKNNTSMRQIILDVNFTHPFYGSDLNTWTSPELDATVMTIQQNPEIKTVVDRLKSKFLNEPEALSHGDLHTGSILVTHSDTRIIDTEFATYAPISFDIGMLLANFLMTHFAAEAHSIDQNWIAQTICGIWDVFEKELKGLWKNREVLVDEKLDEIWDDVLRLIGVEIIRRTIGVAHNADFETIRDRSVKAKIEKKALLFAKELTLRGKNFIPNSKILLESIYPFQFNGTQKD